MCFFTAASVVWYGSAARAQSPFLLDTEAMELKRTGQAPEEVDRVIKDAESVLEKRPRSVVEKEQVPPSGDRHDFYDQATYWWPDPEQPDGKPYIQKDGKVNPEIGEIPDSRNMVHMARDVITLAKAWYYSGDERFAEHAVKFLRVWFLEADTRMNPNLNYVAMIPGRNENSGRGSGLIRTRVFVDMLDGVLLLLDSELWTDEDHKALQGWFGEYAEWMKTSRVGRAGREQPNNIGTAYDMQLVYYALFTEDEELARSLLTEQIPARMDEQFDEDGRQPHELRRTRSWGYSIANLNYWFRLAKLAEHLDIDLWRYETSSGKSLKKGYRFLESVACGNEKWEYDQIGSVDFRSSLQGLEINAPPFYKSWNYP